MCVDNIKLSILFGKFARMKKQRPLFLVFWSFKIA